MFGFRDRFTYFQCSRCECLQIAEIPDRMGRYYPPTYYSFAAPRLDSLAGTRWRRFAQRLRDRYAITGRGVFGRVLYRRWPDHALRRLAAAAFPSDGRGEIRLTPRHRILDVGCGGGELLLALYGAGFRRLLGVDMYLEQDVSYPGGLRILRRSIHDLEGRWDLVMMHHSFEHMADPKETLEAVARRLSPRGVCLIRIPLASSYAWARYKVDWVQMDPPRHFFLHSTQSMTRLATAAGLRIVRVVYDSGPFQFVGSELYRRDIPLVSTDAADVAARATAFTPQEIEAFEDHAGRLNREGRGDQAAFYMRLDSHR